MTKKLYLITFIGFLNLFHMQQVLAKSLFEKYPIQEEVTLSTGDRMALPLQDYDSSGLVLMGTASLKSLKKILLPHGLQPLALTRNKGFVMFFAMDYRQTGIGAYQELVVLIATAQGENSRVPILEKIRGLNSFLSVFYPLINGRFDSEHKKYPFFTWKLFVTTSIAEAAGIEVWGYPKSLADINVNVGTPKESFRVAVAGSEVVSASRELSSKKYKSLGMDMRMISPRTYKQVSSRGIAETQAQINVFKKKKDHFVLNTNTEWGKNLSEIDFKPLAWQSMPLIQAVFLKP